VTKENRLTVTGDRMKFWLYLTAKLAGASATSYLLLIVVFHYVPRPPRPTYGQEQPFLHDLRTTFAIFFVWLIGVGLIYLAIWDQRRRCRTCLRHLIMPISTGSWSNMLTFGRPQTEWICPFGHGTLRISDLQITGSEKPDWEPHQDMWQELESYDQTRE
jgi:hypothetical protein